MVKKWRRIFKKSEGGRMNEQKELIAIKEKYKEIKEGKKEKRKWYKWYGDICVRILQEHISKILPKNYKLSSPYAYIEEFPYEFDLLIIKNSSSPIKYTNMYCSKDVRIGIEVKARGVYGGKEDARKAIQKIRNNFDNIKKKHEDIDFIYFTYEERCNPKRKTSINYWKLTQEGFKNSPYGIFCLQDSCTKQEMDGWKNLVKYLKDLTLPF